MDLFENMDKIKENMVYTLDKITDEKKVIYDQIKRLETENYIIQNNLEYFEAYLNFLEYKKVNNNNSISSIDNSISNNNYQQNYLKFENFINLNKYQNNSKVENPKPNHYFYQSNSMDIDTNLFINKNYLK